MINELKKKLYRWLLTKTRESIKCKHMWKKSWSSGKRTDDETRYGSVWTSHEYCELCSEWREVVTDLTQPKTETMLQSSRNLKFLKEQLAKNKEKDEN